MPMCRHKRKGIVTNQPNGIEWAKPHAARDTCDRPDCIVATGRWVSGITGMTAYYRADANKDAGWIPVDEVPR